MDDQKQKQKQKQKKKPETFAGGPEIAMPVLPSMGSYISDDVRSCANDDYFDLPIFANIAQFQSEKNPILGISNGCII